MITAIRRTLDHELAVNPRVLVFGEDVGPKGGVHGVTLGLQEKYGAERVFDTSLSEEGIIGRAVGMAIAGLMPVPEIQFRKYADPADRADQRLRHDALAHREPLCRADGGAHADWLLQVRRSRGTARPTKCSSCTAPGWRVAVPVERGRRGRPAAHGAARQRSGDVPRTPQHARRRERAPALSGRRFRAAVRRRAARARGRRHHHRHLGRDGGALRSGGGQSWRRREHHRSAHAWRRGIAKRCSRR